MRIVKSLLLVVIFFALCAVKPADAKETNTPNEEFFRAKVLRVMESGSENVSGVQNNYQIVELELLDGDRQGEVVRVEHGRTFSLDESQFVKPRDTVVVVESGAGDEGDNALQIIDQYRLDAVLPIIFGFFVLVMFLSRWHGVGSILGLLISLGVISGFVVPQIIAGSSPVVVSVIGCVVIMLFTLYLAHGFNQKTTVALVSTSTTLVITGLLSALFVAIARLSGLGSDEAAGLKFGVASMVNFQGLLLGGMLIGALGVLDDVTTSLAATVFEISKANPRMGFEKLFASGLSVGREHVSSLVNTLAMAYAGASMPIFLTIVINPSNYPLWTILNSEMLMEEVIRTLAGGFGLVLAVPITTFVAAGYLSGKFGMRIRKIN